MDKEATYSASLKELHETGSYRFLRQTDNGLIDLSSNDYLGLNSDNELYKDFIEDFAQNQYKFSAVSSRLLSGNSPEYEHLEKLISSLYNKEACLVYNSGYHANTGILPTLASKNDLIIADKFVHASIIDGAKLSTADFKRYRHLDYQHLENMLQKKRATYKNVFIVSESIFSMDGDEANLNTLLKIKEKYNCFLYIDEAHAVGVRGNSGLGCTEEQGVLDNTDFIVGTFGKALASVGAYVVCNNVFKEYLVNHSRTLIFTTALPPVNLAWTKFIFERLSDFNDKRKALSRLVDEFSKHLNINAESHIIPYVVGENEKAVQASEKLIENGYNVLPIRFPTVPKGTSRLRFSLRADFDMNDLWNIKAILDQTK